ncbi:TetR/AcrR family transcriptional regulator [Variovorax sp. VaC1]|uniref:TetR/AcrR family transcriptional regulator n=1 Tax=Variovorax sp. VaC1 TaxID=3373132 RepID=UPI00374808A6
MNDDPRPGEKSPPTPRKRPSQERGVARYNKLLDAAHALLIENELDEIGLYQTAKKAGVPPASAYHFFPTPGALLLALAERYHEEFSELARKVDTRGVKSWQALLQLRLSAAVQIYNQNPPIQKLFLGSHTTRELVQSEAGFNELLARRMLGFYEQFFHMPHIRDAEHKFLIMLTLVDSVWSLSFSKHRTITAQFEEEALAVAVAYCRTFLPEVIEPREPAAPAEAEPGTAD